VTNTWGKKVHSRCSLVPSALPPLPPPPPSAPFPWCKSQADSHMPGKCPTPPVPAPCPFTNFRLRHPLWNHATAPPPSASRTCAPPGISHLPPPPVSCTCSPLYLAPGPPSPPALHKAHLHHPPKHGVLVVQPRRRRARNKELRPVCVGSRICHRDRVGAVVPQAAMELILKLVAPNGGT
jgi:hypothetical protein